LEKGNRKLVAALACRNQGSRLYGKPLQNLDVENGIRVIDNIIDGLKEIESIDSIVLAISEGEENKAFIKIAEEKSLEYIVGDEKDVLLRLILACRKSKGTDVFRVTSESPFLYFNAVNKAWDKHCKNSNDGTFYDEIIDGCGFEIIKLESLELSHKKGESRHRSEMCTLFIRENPKIFKIKRIKAPIHLNRKDLRLTVDNPEDLVICRKIFEKFCDQAPKINLEDIINFLDQNKSLKSLIYPFTEKGYKTMYI